MSDFKELEEGVARLEAVAADLEKATSGAQRLATDLHRRNLRPEHEREELEKLRTDTLSAHKNSIDAIRIAADDLVSTVATDFTTESLSRRAAVAGGPRSDSEKLIARGALRQELASSSDDDVLGFATDFVREGNFGAFRMAMSEARGRGKNLVNKLAALKVQLGEHPQAVEASKLAQRAKFASQQAAWAAEKLRNLQAGEQPEPSKTEQAERTAREVKAQQPEGWVDRIATRFFGEAS